MIGIVWSDKLEDGQNKLEEIIHNYNQCRIEIKEYRKGRNDSRVAFSNGDTWYACKACENIRGRRCNISYIDRTISDEIIEHIIKPATHLSPYIAYKYYWPSSVPYPEEEL